MAILPLQAVWVWILLGIGVAVSAWWATVRPGKNSGHLFAPALGVVIILLLVVLFQGAATGELPLDLSF
ncbi:MAG: hypothetical protein JXQ73_21410 [Phycisphaerae bacterium]|nr:hypothetical protein [Phycisphaerae bacterium]